MAKPSLAWRLKRPANLLLVAVGIAIVLGTAWRIFESGHMRIDVASALFVIGGIVIAGAAATGGGARGQRLRAYDGGGTPNDMPFGAVLIAVLVIVLGIGVLRV